MDAKSLSLLQITDKQITFKSLVYYTSTCKKYPDMFHFEYSPAENQDSCLSKLSPNVICEWDKIDINIRSSTSFLGFKNTVPKEIRPSRRLIFGDHNPRGLKFLTRLRMCFSNLREHKFKHIFQDLLIYSVIVALISRRRLIFSIIAIFLYTSANVS